MVELLVQQGGDDLQHLLDLPWREQLVRLHGQISAVIDRLAGPAELADERTQRERLAFHGSEQGRKQFAGLRTLHRLIEVAYERLGGKMSR